jgi:hypothetical protein
MLSGACAVFREADVEKRLCRLEELTRGLSKEVALWKEGNDPLLYLERKSYLNAIQDALAGVEAARVVLARALQRMQTDRERGPGRKDEGEGPPAAHSQAS